MVVNTRIKLIGEHEVTDVYRKIKNSISDNRNQEDFSRALGKILAKSGARLTHDDTCVYAEFTRERDQLLFLLRWA
jgi:hypothetical protein